MVTTWRDVRAELHLSEEDEAVIVLEKDLIKTLVRIREEQGLSQAQLAERCKCKQPAIARLETGMHSPQVSSLLKVLVPLGYTLRIEPLGTKKITS